MQQAEGSNERGANYGRGSKQFPLRVSGFPDNQTQEIEKEEALWTALTELRVDDFCEDVIWLNPSTARVYTSDVEAANKVLRSAGGFQHADGVTGSVTTTVGPLSFEMEIESDASMSLNTALLDMLSSRGLDGRLQQLYSANHISVKDTLATGLLSNLATLQRGI